MKLRDLLIVVQFGTKLFIKDKDSERIICYTSPKDTSLENIADRIIKNLWLEYDALCVEIE